MKLEINKRVYEARRKKGLTQKIMAKKMGLNETTYSQMEREGEIKANRLVQIAEILDVIILDLLYGNEPDTSAVPNQLGFAQPAFLEDQIADSQPLILRKQEENFIKVLRSLSKEDKNEVIAFLDSKNKKK